MLALLALVAADAASDAAASHQERVSELQHLTSLLDSLKHADGDDGADDEEPMAIDHDSASNFEEAAPKIKMGKNSLAHIEVIPTKFQMPDAFGSSTFKGASSWGLAQRLAKVETDKAKRRAVNADQEERLEKKKEHFNEEIDEQHQKKMHMDKRVDQINAKVTAEMDNMEERMQKLRAMRPVEKSDRDAIREMEREGERYKQTAEFAKKMADAKEKRDAWEAKMERSIHRYFSGPGDDEGERSSLAQKEHLDASLDPAHLLSPSSTSFLDTSDEHLHMQANAKAATAHAKAAVAHAKAKLTEAKKARDPADPAGLGRELAADAEAAERVPEKLLPLGVDGLPDIHGAGQKAMSIAELDAKEDQIVEATKDRIDNDKFKIPDPHRWADEAIKQMREDARGVEPSRP